MKGPLLFIITVLFLTAPLWAQERGVQLSEVTEQRVALIIGNAEYEDSPLLNPVHDAEDIASALKRLGFDVQLLTNADRRQMRKAIRVFGDKLQKGGVGLFFFAGHGMQVDGVNYLIPVKADIEREDEVMDEAIDGNAVLRKMESAGNRMNMVFLDACRNNPFARSFRSGNKGLAQMDAPKGSIVAYATSPGSTAADGDGRNGVFTENLLKNINTPGLEIGQLMRKVRSGVMETTDDAQIPWDSSSLTGNFYFRGGPDNTTEVASNQFDEEEEFWAAIKNSSNPEDLLDYIRTYPEGRFVPIARVKIRQLEGKESSTEEAPAPAERTVESVSEGNGWVMHGSATLLALVGYSLANADFGAHEDLQAANAALAIQYEASISSTQRDEISLQYTANQNEMKALESSIQTFNMLTLVALGWEGYLLYDDMSGSAQLERPQERNFWLASDPEQSEVTMNVKWRF